jgi:hypothetical protein
MKKALIALNAFFLIVICFLACQQGEPNGAELSACTKLHAKDYSGKERKGFLNVKAAKEMADRYDADKEKAYISEDGHMTNIEDAHRVWFSIEELKQYIWMMEDTLCKQGCNMDSLNLGIHIYFAKYPDSTGTAALGADPKYSKHQTVFMTATYKGIKNNVDFDPWHIGTQKCKPTPLSAFLRLANNKDGMMLKGAGDEGDAGVLNHGNLAPPPGGSGGFPTDDDSEN